MDKLLKRMRGVCYERLPRKGGCVAAIAAMIFVPVGAAETEIMELLLSTDTNAVIEVAAGDVTFVSKISGDRGNVTKTGDGVLEVRLLRNTKARFDVQGGKLRFARQMPRICEDAFFHVDASRADTLDLEEVNGTNFVVRWNDVRGNGLFATNCLAEPVWRTNPERRRAFISSVTQNGMPVVDFGPMMFQAYTNELGEALGYGATMIWSEACTNVYEVYEVISETPDVATIAVDYPQFHDKITAVSFLSSSYDRAGNYRETLKSNTYPNVFYDNSNNRGWMHGRIYLDGTATSPNSNGVYGKFNLTAGFHLLGFTTRQYVNGVEGNELNEYKARLNSFARDYNYSFGAQRLAEYLVFSNRLDSAQRTTLQAYLKEKWFGIVPAYIVSEIKVADGASVEFASGVKVKLANVADDADISVVNGSMELNPLNNPDAFFHVDADDASSLLLEEVNGTNFIRRWSDVLGNGMYATNWFGTYTYRSDPENRFPYMSAEKLNNRPVVDFGSLLVPAYTNETGHGIGYGGCLKWSSRMTAGAREAFIVTRDTEDVKTLYSQPGVGTTYFGQAYICDPDDMHGFRHQLANGYPYIAYDNAYNNSIKSGTIYVDGVSRGFKSWRPTEGFHVFNFQLANDALIKSQWFAYSRPKYSNNDRCSFGGTRIAEYLVFPNVLSNDVRSAIYSALRTKWFDATNRVMTVRNLAVAPGASLAVKWQNVVVANLLTAGGLLKADSVKAAALALPAAVAQVEGSLTVEDGADVTVDVQADGSLARLSATSLTLSGGGRVVISNPASFCPAAGEYPVLVSEEAVASAGVWTIEASGITKVSASLVERADGLYVRFDPKGMMFIVR